MYKSKLPTDYFAYFLLIITVSLWGLAWPIGRLIVSTHFGDSVPPFIIICSRYIIFVSLLFLVTFLKEKSFGFEFFKQNWKDLSIMGLISVTFYQFGYLYGETYTAASDASLVVATSPIIVLFVAAALIKERITPLKIIGSFLAFVGVLVIVGFSPNTNVPNRFLGDGLVLISAFSYGTYTVLLRRLYNKYEKKPSSFHVLVWLSLMGLIFSLPIALLTGPQYFLDPAKLFFIQSTTRTIEIWMGILYLAIFSSLIAYLFYAEAVKHIDASRAAVFVNLVPVVGVSASVFIGETIDPFVHFLSFLLIFTGIMLVNKKPKPVTSTTTPPPLDSDIQPSNTN